MNSERRSFDDCDVERWIDEAAARERQTPIPDSRAFLHRVRARLEHRPHVPRVAARAEVRPRGGALIAAAIPLLILLAVAQLGSPPDVTLVREPEDAAIIRDLELFELLDGLESELEALEAGSLLEYVENVPYLDDPDAELLEVSG